MAAIDWTPQLTENVLKSITEGSTLREAGESHSISASAIIRKVESDEEFSKQYARALQIRTETDFEGLEDELREQPRIVKGFVDPAWVQLKRLQVDTRKWALSKRNPKKYGDKQEIAVTGLDLASRLSAARERKK